MHDGKSTAALVREARTRSGLTQRELARRAGTAQSVVGRIEAEVASPSFETVARLLDAAGFQFDVELLPKSVGDSVTEAYKRDVDRTLLRENLRKTVEERLRTNIEMLIAGNEMRRAMRAVDEP